MKKYLVLLIFLLFMVNAIKTTFAGSSNHWVTCATSCSDSICGSSGSWDHCCTVEQTVSGLSSYYRCCLYDGSYQWLYRTDGKCPSPPPPPDPCDDKGLYNCYDTLENCIYDCVYYEHYLSGEVIWDEACAVHSGGAYPVLCICINDGLDCDTSDGKTDGCVGDDYYDYSCYDQSCVPDISEDDARCMCIDHDSPNPLGVQYETPSYCSDVNGAYNDGCSGDYVRDRECYYGNCRFRTSDYNCKNNETVVCDTGSGDIIRNVWGCVLANGKGYCKNTGTAVEDDCSDTCSDTDGGTDGSWDYQTVGTYTDENLCSGSQTSCPSSSNTDSCIDANWLREYRCVGNDFGQMDYNCALIGAGWHCTGGKCVGPTCDCSSDSQCSSDGCSGTSYRDYYCDGCYCQYNSDSCTDCSCTCGGYGVTESTANGNCNDGIDNDCDTGLPGGGIDSADSGCGVCNTGDTQTCTRCSGVNYCTGGTQTCDATGNWGICTGGSCSCVVGQCGATASDCGVCNTGDTQTCTRCSGVNYCTGGTQTCDATGNWGICTGGSCSCVVGQCGATASDCCSDDCSTCSDCGGGADCKDYTSCSGFSTTCDNTGTWDVTTHTCTPGGDGCNDCSQSTTSESCTRNTDGTICGDVGCDWRDDCGTSDPEIYYDYHDCNLICSGGSCPPSCTCGLDTYDCSQTGDPYPGSRNNPAVACNCNCDGYDVVESEANNNCEDGIDNDCDGLIDGDDRPDCPPNNIVFSGNLQYSTLKPVSNSWIQIKISNETYGYEKSSYNETESDGDFTVTIMHIPNNMMGANFYVSIYVVGEVEALYECYYDGVFCNPI